MSATSHLSVDHRTNMASPPAPGGHQRTFFAAASVMADEMNATTAIEALLADNPSTVAAQAAGLFYLKAASRAADALKASRSALAAAEGQIATSRALLAGAAPIASSGGFRHPGMSASLSAQVDARLKEDEAWADELEGMFGDEFRRSPEERVEQARRDVLRGATDPGESIGEIDLTGWSNTAAGE